MQLTIYDLIADENPAEEELPAVELLFRPNGRRRCEHCRRRLSAFAGRLLCVNPHCPGVPR